MLSLAGRLELGSIELLLLALAPVNGMIKNANTAVAKAES